MSFINRNPLSFSRLHKATFPFNDPTSCIDFASEGSLRCHRGKHLRSFHELQMSSLRACWISIAPLEGRNCYITLVFSRVHATLELAVSVCPSAGPSVTFLKFGVFRVIWGTLRYFRVTPVPQLFQKDQITVKSKRQWITKCRFFHQLEPQKIYILLMNFTFFALCKIEWDEK